MLEQLTEIIREYKRDASITLNEDTTLMADLELDSFDLINLVCKVEDAFDIEIPDRKIKDFRTVGDVMGFIQEHV